MKKNLMYIMKFQKNIRRKSDENTKNKRLKGSPWYSDSTSCLVKERSSYDAMFGHENFGFRIVRTI